MPCRSMCCHLSPSSCLPSSSSSIWHISFAIHVFFFCGLTVSTVMLVWQCCHQFFSACYSKLQTSSAEWMEWTQSNSIMWTCTITYAVHHGLAPSHITELKTSVAAQTSSCPRLRSADTTNYAHCSTSDTDEVRRTGFLPCRPCCMELATGWTSTNTDFHVSPASNATSRCSNFNFIAGAL